jgi:thiol-disulfide isomerase/thioredoxin
MVLFAFVLMTLPVSGQEANVKTEKIIALEDAKTVDAVEKWYAKSVAQVYKLEPSKIRLKAGEKILEIAKTNDEKKKGYQYKFIALSDLVKAGDEESQKKLDQLTKELESDENFRSVIYDEQFQKFISQSLLKNKDDFEKFHNELKTWLNKPFVTHRSVIRSSLRRAKTYATTIAKDDPDFFPQFVHELIDYVKSPENTLAESVKKEILEQLEAITRTKQGNDLKLYGKTLDDKDFDWNSLRGNNVIVKFTATWCGPCKAELSGLISAYEKYKGKGLKIVSIYIWERGDDSDKIVENVKKFAKDENISWLIVSEALTEKAGQPKQGIFYGIQSVPTMLLIDKDGKIIDTNARGEHLQKKLAELFPDEK